MMFEKKLKNAASIETLDKLIRQQEKNKESEDLVFVILFFNLLLVLAYRSNTAHLNQSKWEILFNKP